MTGCGECQGWPGHHPGCSKYGIPRTEAGARLLVTLENLIYRGGTIGDVARIDIVSIEDEAEVRAANRGVTAPTQPAEDDAAKLRVLATWFDNFDDWREATAKIAPGIAEYREVQQDLRRIADYIAQPAPDPLHAAAQRVVDWGGDTPEAVVRIAALRAALEEGDQA